MQKIDEKGTLHDIQDDRFFPDQKEVQGLFQQERSFALKHKNNNIPQVGLGRNAIALTRNATGHRLAGAGGNYKIK